MLHTYNGISLKQYCINNNLKYETILKRMTTLRKKNNKLTNEEIIEQALNSTDNIHKLMYKGIPLIKYCEQNNLRYNTIIGYIHREKKNNSNLTIEEIVDGYSKCTHKKNSKYMYQGITLRKYCEQNNIKYMNILKYISKYRLNKNNPPLTDDELVSKAIDIYTEIFYKGISLKIYCEYKDRLKYIDIKNYILNRKKENPNITDNELIDEYIEKKYKRHGKYMYQGILLADFCREYNINADNIRRSMRRFKKRNKDLNISDEDIIKIVIEKHMGLYPTEIKQIEKKKEKSYHETKHTEEVNEISEQQTEQKDKKRISKKELYKILKELPRNDFEFIILKYQHKYSDVDLAKYFNITLVDVINKNEELITLLKEQYHIKVLTKKR